MPFSTLPFRGELYSVACDRWMGTMAEDVRAQMARVASASAWAMGEWSMMEEYSRCIPRDTNEGSFYRAVLAVHKDQHHVAQQVCIYLVVVYRRGVIS